MFRNPSVFSVALKLHLENRPHSYISLISYKVLVIWICGSDSSDSEDVFQDMTLCILVDMYNTSVSEEPAVCMIIFFKNIGTYLPDMPSLPRDYQIFNRAHEIQLLNVIINMLLVNLLVFVRPAFIMALSEITVPCATSGCI